MTEPGAPAGSPLQGLALHSVEWLIFVKDCQLTSLKLETPQLIELLPQSADPSGAPAGAPLASFLSGLLNLAFWRSNAGLGGDARTATAGLARGERRLRPLPECITTALRDCVLPLARRDTSQRFRARCVARGPPAPGTRPPPAGTPRPLPPARCQPPRPRLAPARPRAHPLRVCAGARRLAQDDEAQALLKQYRKPLQALFDQLVESGPPEAAGLGLDCGQALEWLEQSGGVGECHVPLAKGRSESDQQPKSLSSFLTVHLARQAFVDSLPLQLREGQYLASCLASLRQFQEWLVRCAELKYCVLEQQSLAARTHGLLQNVIDGRSTEEVLLQATHTSRQAEVTFDARTCPLPTAVSASTQKLFLTVWDQLDMSGIQGVRGREQSVFLLLLSHLSSLVAVFAHYCGSSLSRSEAEAIGLLELQGWTKFVIDGHVCTKSFTARAAYEVFQTVLDASGTPRTGLDLAEFVQCVLTCAYQRTNAALLQLHERTAHRLFPIDHCLKTFLSSVLPHARSRDVLELHLRCAKSPGLQRLLDEKQDAVLQTLSPPNAPLKASLGDHLDGSITLDALLASLDRAGVLRDLKIELDVWTPVFDYGVKQGQYFRKLFKSALSSEDVKQAAVDTILTVALTDGAPLQHGKGVASMPLSASLLLQTTVRLAAVAYSQIPHLDIEQSAAIFFEHLLTPELDAGDAVMRHMSALAPARTSDVVFELGSSRGMGGYAAREHAAWLAVWQDVDLSRLPGFPLWERPVFELLQALPLSPFTHPTEPSCTHRARVHAWFMHHRRRAGQCCEASFTFTASEATTLPWGTPTR